MAYLPPIVGPSGLTVPKYSDILADNVAQFLKIFGANQYVGVDSAIYQLLAILSLKQSDTMAALQYAYNQSSPATAIGAGLDRIIKINGLVRKPYSFSLAILTVTGVPGTVITNGVAQDQNGNQWALPSTVTIPGGGTINVTATCTLPGSITALAGSITIIATPTGGWTSVTNAATSSPGTPIEADSQVRARQAISVALPSKTMFAGTIAAIAQILGVTRYNVLENPTGGVDSFGNPAHSITAVVEGGVQQAIAQAIYNNRGIGCLTNGNVGGSAIAQTVTINIADPVTGFIIPISFINPPQYVPIFVTVNAHLLAGGTTATITAIQTAIVNYLNSLQIGELVSFGALYAAAMAVNPNLSAPIFTINSLFSGLSASPSGTSDIAMLFYKVAQGVTGDVVVNSV